MYNWLLITLLVISTNLFSQNIAIGQWRTHLGYGDAISLADAGDTIFCGTKTGLFYYNSEWKTINGLSKVNGFKDIAIKVINYNPKNHRLYIAYQNTQIDIFENGFVLNIPDIFRFNGIIGIKEIHNFDFHDNSVFVSTSFGIVKMDERNNVVLEDYREIYPVDGSQVQVYDVAFYNDSIYAATEKGLLTSAYNKSVNLRDFKNWKIVTTNPCRVVDTFNNMLFVVDYLKSSLVNTLKYYNGKEWKSIVDTNIYYTSKIHRANDKLLLLTDVNKGVDKNYITYVSKDLKTTHTNATLNDFIIDKNNASYSATSLYGVIREQDGKVDYLKPNGPFTVNAYYLHNYKSDMYLAIGGARADFAPNYFWYGFSYYSNGWWETKNGTTDPKYPKQPEYSDYFFDVSVIASNKDLDIMYFGSMVAGLMEYKNGQPVAVYNQLNSPIRHRANGDSIEPKKITGLAFDKDNNLWISNFMSPKPLIVKTKEGKFKAFDVGSSFNKKDLAHLTTDEYNKVWAITPLFGGLVVFSYGKNLEDESDDAYRELTIGKGNGDLPDNKVNCIVSDKEGLIWIGTNNGIAYFPDASQPIKSRSYDFVKPYIESENVGGYLLSGEIVTCMAVDGANRKWIGTRRGVWLVNQDGTKIEKSFTTENSPLISDIIKTIAVNGETGEVFIGTDLGVVSYRDIPTEGNEQFQGVYAFPNPVKPDYEGIIAIKGLIRNTVVKITDITGSLVYETVSQGGTATWDGKNFKGKKASSGVYLVFLASEDGLETEVTKILIVR